jgi:hypothetical protein
LTGYISPSETRTVTRASYWQVTAKPTGPCYETIDLSKKVVID